MGDQESAARALRNARRSNPQRNCLVTAISRHLWGSSWNCRMGLAIPWMDASLHGLRGLSAVVFAGLLGDISGASRHMVLLDPSLDAPAAPVQAGACGTSCEQASDCLGGDELSPSRSYYRRGGHPGAGLARSHPCGGARGGTGDHDHHGHHQSYGLGNVSARACSFQVR